MMWCDQRIVGKTKLVIQLLALHNVVVCLVYDAEIKLVHVSFSQHYNTQDLYFWYWKAFTCCSRPTGFTHYNHVKWIFVIFFFKLHCSLVASHFTDTESMVACVKLIFTGSWSLVLCMHMHGRRKSWCSSSTVLFPPTSSASFPRYDLFVLTWR